jgi:hypothetical protein
LTLTIDTAPKLWKYMLSTNSAASAVVARPSTAPVRHSTPISAFAASVPAAEIRIVRRPPSRSASGPLTRNDTP